MRITYVVHNCFFIENKDEIIAFDFPEQFKKEHLEILRERLKGKRVSFFFSHSHSDHFNSDIDNLFLGPDFEIEYIVSRDVLDVFGNFSPKRVRVLEDNRRYEISCRYVGWFSHQNGWRRQNRLYCYLPYS
jgi:L-ascorbate metabolism protein UlaG (beta-lactamase superfamily)